MTIDGKEILDDDELANCFNSFFTTLSSESHINKCESANFIFNTFKELKFSDSSSIKPNGFSFHTLSTSSIMKYINQLPNSSSAGITEIPTKVLKQASEYLLLPLTKIYNCCLHTGIIPDDFKVAVVTPLYKNKGDKADINNYRGISVLSPFAKVFEKAIAEQITFYFESNQLFYQGQHGFRRGLSCETALNELIDHVNGNLDKQLISLLLFVDFRKAFDIVDSDLLILKLFHYGFDNSSIKVMRNYFTNRSQITKLGKTSSTNQNIILGVPQGSILGPLLFLIFINDMSFYIIQFMQNNKNSIVEMFADDTTVGNSASNYDDLICHFKHSLQHLLNWCLNNRLDINWNKTYIMIITHKKIDIPKTIDIEVLNKSLSIQVVQQFKLLGVTIDDKLTFSQHVANICKKINMKLYSIKRLFYLPTAVKLQFFKTFILPFYDFGLSLVIYMSKHVIQKLANSYYLCLIKLFKFNFCNMSNNTINDYLKRYNLFAFSHRILYRLILFSHKLANTSHTISKYIKYKDESNTTMCLRNSQDVSQPTINNRYGELTLTYFYCKFLNKVCIYHLRHTKLETLKTHILKDLNVMYDNLVIIFDKFNVICKYYF